MPEPSPSKKPRLTSPPSSPSKPTTSASSQLETQSQIANDHVKPTEEEEDPDAVAPASTAGAHAKPLSALMGGAMGVGGRNTKGKGKGREEEKEGFESVLARLMEVNGKLLHSTVLLDGKI
jgi:hypothetical protein